MKRCRRNGLALLTYKQAIDKVMRPKTILLFFVLINFFITIIVSPAIAAGEKKTWNFRKRGEDRLAKITESDITAEIEFGKMLSAKILGKYKLYENKELEKYVNLVGKTIARYAGRPELTFRFAVLDTDAINAYAAPGGYVFITRGALKLMRNEADLASVLAHEISHVSKKHIVKELNIKGSDNADTSTLTLLVQTIGGGGNVEVAFLELTEKAAELLFEKGLKQEDEFEADLTGTLLMAQVGYYTPGLMEYLKIIKKVKGDDKAMKVYNKTHPSFDDRIKRLIDFDKENGLSTLEGKKLEERFKKVWKTINWKHKENV